MWRTNENSTDSPKDSRKDSTAIINMTHLNALEDLFQSPVSPTESHPNIIRGRSNQGEARIGRSRIKSDRNGKSEEESSQSARRFIDGARRVINHKIRRKKTRNDQSDSP